MNWNQIYKLLKVALVAILIMFVFEVIFELPFITNGISNYLTSIDNMFWIWGAIWLIMFIQVSIVPIPAYIVINAAIQLNVLNRALGLGLITDPKFWIFIAVTMTAFIAGIIVAYLIGYKWGRKAVKWSAGSDEEYDKWATFLNEKGKIWYFLTVILPIFPDDLLCIVAGAVKFDFKWFLFSNIIGRFVGLITMVLFLTLVSSLNSGGFPWTILIWGIILLINITAVLYVRKYKLKSTE